MTNKIEQAASDYAMDTLNAAANEKQILFCKQDFIAGANYAMSIQKQEAVGFAEYIRKNNWVNNGEGRFKTIYDIYLITTSELYAKFQSEKGAWLLKTNICYLKIPSYIALNHFWHDYHKT